MKPDDNSFIQENPLTPNELFTAIKSQSDVYKSALEIILSLCESYSVTLSDIKGVCETVLKEGKKDE